MRARRARRLRAHAAGHRARPRARRHGGQRHGGDPSRRRRRTPKGAELTNAKLTRNCAIGALLDLGLLQHGARSWRAAAVSLLRSNLRDERHDRGGTLTLVPRFDPGQVLEVVQRDRVNVFQGVPTMYGAMLHHPGREQYDLSRLQLCASGGSAMPVELMRRLRSGVRLQGAGRLRAIGNLPGRVVQPSRSRAQTGLDRNPDRGRRGIEGHDKPTDPQDYPRARSARS